MAKEGKLRHMMWLEQNDTLMTWNPRINLMQLHMPNTFKFGQMNLYSDTGCHSIFVNQNNIKGQFQVLNNPKLKEQCSNAQRVDQRFQSGWNQVGNLKPHQQVDNKPQQQQLMPQQVPHQVNTQQHMQHQPQRVGLQHLPTFQYHQHLANIAQQSPAYDPSVPPPHVPRAPQHQLANNPAYTTNNPVPYPPQMQAGHNNCGYPEQYQAHTPCVNEMVSHFVPKPSTKNPHTPVSFGSSPNKVGYETAANVGFQPQGMFEYRPNSAKSACSLVKGNSSPCKSRPQTPAVPTSFAGNLRKEAANNGNTTPATYDGPRLHQAVSLAQLAQKLAVKVVNEEAAGKESNTSTDDIKIPGIKGNPTPILEKLLDDWKNLGRNHPSSGIKKEEAGESVNLPRYSTPTEKDAIPMFKIPLVKAPKPRASLRIKLRREKRKNKVVDEDDECFIVESPDEPVAKKREISTSPTSPDMDVALDKGLSPTIPSTKIIGQVIIKEDNSSQ